MRNLLFQFCMAGLFALAVTLLVGLVLGCAEYLAQTKTVHGPRGLRRRETVFQCVATVFMVGLMEALVLPSRLWHRVKFRKAVCFANIAEGQHLNGNVTYKADAGLVGAGRYACVKLGSDASHITVSTAADVGGTMGICTDEALAAEDSVNVAMLGAIKGTIKVQNSAAGAVAAGGLVVPDAGGQVKALPAGAGNYFIVGRALGAAAAQGDQIEIVPLGVWKTQ
jgi:hypothetical protein